MLYDVAILLIRVPNCVHAVLKKFYSINEAPVNRQEFQCTNRSLLLREKLIKQSNDYKRWKDHQCTELDRDLQDSYLLSISTFCFQENLSVCERTGQCRSVYRIVEHSIGLNSKGVELTVWHPLLLPKIEKFGLKKGKLATLTQSLPPKAQWEEKVLKSEIKDLFEQINREMKWHA